MKRIKLRGGDEYDALTPARRFYCYFSIWCGKEDQARLQQKI